MAAIIFVKWALKWLEVLAALCAVITGVVVAWMWWSMGRHLASVTPQIFIQGEFCKKDPRFPITVGFSNESSRVITEISMNVSAHLPENSTNVLVWQQVEMDDVVNPGERMLHCYSFEPKAAYKDNPGLSSAIYEVKVERVTFE